MCQFDSKIVGALLDGEAIAAEHEAVHQLAAQFYPDILTDNLELIRKTRARR